MMVRTAWRLGAGLGWLLAGSALLLSSCADSKSNTNPGGTSGRGGGGGTSSEPTCRAGESCECASGRSGETVCDGDMPRCECPACDPLLTVDAPTVEGCGGEPFGTWRLKQADWGTSMLTITVANEVHGS